MISITTAGSEFGRVLRRRLRQADDGPSALINNALQPANSLLHDGHAWKRLTPRRILSLTAKMLAGVEAREAGFVVHASFAFLRAAEDAPTAVGDRLRPIVDAIQEAEQLVLQSDLPSCVVRVGYLYGPEMRDFRLYRTAFRLGRPFWAGNKRRLQHFIHSADAAAGLVEVARRRPAGRTLYLTDDKPVAFATFGDHLGRLFGNPLPAHLWRISRPFAHIVVAEEHMQMVEVGVHGQAPDRVPRFQPRYADYKSGLKAAVAALR